MSGCFHVHIIVCISNCYKSKKMAMERCEFMLLNRADEEKKKVNEYEIKH